MIRRPLRPLARIITAREGGEDPDTSEAEARLAAARARARKQQRRARTRMGLLAILFLAAYGVVATRMFLIASGDVAQTPERVAAHVIRSDRADILDRQGRILATNVTTPSLYARTQLLIDPEAAAEGLARIFPDLDRDTLLRRFEPPTKFAWIKRRLSPEQAQAVHDLGEPGLVIGKRHTRVYPNGQLASHVLGGAGYGREDVAAAEVVGRDGVERWFDDRLRERTEEPLVLSLDLAAQAAVEDVLSGGVRLMSAKGGSAVLMDVQTGEVLALASLPDFDPNYRPRDKTSGDPSLSPLFNRASQGRYELGSSYKLFTAAIAIEEGLATPDTLIDTKPMRWGKYPIREYGGASYAPYQSLTDVLVKSSNIGSARLALEFGTETQKAFLTRLGMLEPTALELSSAKLAKPLYPKRWSEISTITISYGHGLSATPLHLAAAYGGLLNGGFKVSPTLVKGGNQGQERDRVVSAATSRALRYMMRKVVTDGTGGLADIAGYAVMGKTGTAEKPNPQGGYFDDRVIANFAAVFPAYAPRYALVVTLDEPKDMRDGKEVRSAAWTAAPVAGEIIRRTAPILGLRPRQSDSVDIDASLVPNARGNVTLAVHGRSKGTAHGQ